MFLSERKLMKMLFDTDAFMSAAIYLQVVLEQEYYPHIAYYASNRGEFGRMLALSTAMQTNIGMAIELALKRVVYANGHSKLIQRHKLNSVYELLSCEVKTELEEIYLKHNRRSDMQMYVIYPVGVKPDPQKVPEVSTFQELLGFLDEHDLYGKRYSFETFEITEPQYIILPNHLNGLINTINRKWQE